MNINRIEIITNPSKINKIMEGINNNLKSNRIKPIKYNKNYCKNNICGDILLESADVKKVPVVKMPEFAVVDITAELMRTDEPGINRVIYPKEIMKKVVAAFKELAKKGIMFGELDHPELPKGLYKTDQEAMQRLASIKMDRVSHMFLDFWWEEPNIIMGKVRILPNKNGNILKSILQAKGTVGFSFRGIGRKKPNGLNFIVEHMIKPVTFDAVANPSFRNSLSNNDTIEANALSESNFKVVSRGKDGYILEFDVSEYKKYDILVEDEIYEDKNTMINKDIALSSFISDLDDIFGLKS